MEKVKNWVVPRKVKDVQKSYGFANFYQWCIQEFAQIAIALVALTRKDELCAGILQCQNAFTMLKQRFTSAPILAYCDATLPSIIETDASDYIVGAIHS